jgi:hypothetical protein
MKNLKHVKLFESFNQSIIDKLKSGETFITSDASDVAPLMIKIQLDSSGNHEGTSDIPELKGLKFHYEFSHDNDGNSTYMLKRK